MQFVIFIGILLLPTSLIHIFARVISQSSSTIHHTAHYKYRNKIKTDDPNIVLFPTPPRLGRSSGPPPPRLASAQTGEIAFLGEQESKTLWLSYQLSLLVSFLRKKAFCGMDYCDKQLSKTSSDRKNGSPQQIDCKKCSNPGRND